MAELCACGQVTVLSWINEGMVPDDLCGPSSLRSVMLGAQHLHRALVLHGATASPECGPSPVRAARRGHRAGGWLCLWGKPVWLGASQPAPCVVFTFQTRKFISRGDSLKSC